MNWIKIEIDIDNKGNVPYKSDVLLRFTTGAYIASTVSYDNEYQCDYSPGFENNYSINEFTHYCVITKP